MRTVLTRSVLVATIVALGGGAGLAEAAPPPPTPGPVSLRVEGSSTSLVPPTVVATQSASFTPVNDPGHNSCPGTSAARALELGTLANGTSWRGAFSLSFGDYLVTSIASEQHPAGSNDGSYWSFWHDHAPAQVGICQQPLNPNDDVLFFPDCFGTCPAGFVSPNVLGMTVPDTAQRQTPITVGVTSYANADGTPSPAGGATVSGGGASVTTAATGRATLAFPSVGTFTLRADAPNAIRSERHLVCVHDGNDGNCGTPTPSGTPPSMTPTPCVHHGEDGLCGTPDKTHPAGRLAIVGGTHFRHGHGPRVLAGRVDTDPSGLRDVLLRVTRLLTHGHCQAYNARRRRFVGARCGVERAPSFSVGKGPAFSYLLPSPLGRGRYTVFVEAIDGAGNHDAPAPPRNWIIFRVA